MPSLVCPQPYKVALVGPQGQIFEYRPNCRLKFLAKKVLHPRSKTVQVSKKTSGFGVSATPYTLNCFINLSTRRTEQAADSKHSKQEPPLAASATAAVLIIYPHEIGMTTPLLTTKVHASVLGDSDKVARPDALLHEDKKR